MEELEGSTVSINVRSFGGASVTIKVGKKAGMENAELLMDEVSGGEKAANGLWHTLTQYVRNEGSIFLVMLIGS